MCESLFKIEIPNQNGIWQKANMKLIRANTKEAKRGFVKWFSWRDCFAVKCIEIIKNDVSDYLD